MVVHQVALHDLRMVDVELQLQVVGADLVDDRHALPGPVDEEARHVAAVDRLQQQFDPGRLQRFRRDLQVRDERAPRRARPDVRRQDAGEAVDARTSEGLRIADGAVNAGPELVRPVRMAGDAALAAVPVPGRQVVQDQREPVGLERLGEDRRFERVGKQELHGREPGPRRCGEAVEERHFGEHQGEVGGKPGHAILPAAPDRVRTPCLWLGEGGSARGSVRGSRLSARGRVRAPRR